MDELTPSELLLYSLLDVSDFGVADGDKENAEGVVVPIVDATNNTISLALNASRAILYELLPDPTSPKAKLALIYFATARLYMILASDIGASVGLVTGRGGQVSLPIGSRLEAEGAALIWFRQARALYPEVLWPPLLPSEGGMQKFRRG